MSNLVKLIPSLVAIATMALGLFSPVIQGYVVAHPVLATSLAGLATILANVVPAPSVKQ